MYKQLFLKITFWFDVFLFNSTTSELSNYFRPTQNSEEPLFFYCDTYFDCFFFLQDLLLAALQFDFYSKPDNTPIILIINTHMKVFSSRVPGILKAGNLTLTEYKVVYDVQMDKNLNVTLAWARQDYQVMLFS
jgi:hypothetical protein